MAKKLSPAQILGRRGGKAKAAKMSPEERSAQATALNRARWEKWNNMSEEERDAVRRKRARKRRKK